jgi:hypothetical protein
MKRRRRLSLQEENPVTKKGKKPATKKKVVVKVETQPAPPPTE